MMMAALLLLGLLFSGAAGQDTVRTADTAAGNVTESEFSLDELEAPPAAKEDGESAEKGGARGSPESHGKKGQHVEAIAVVDATLEVFQGKSREVSFATNHEYLIIGLEPHPNVRFLIEVVDLVYWELQYSFTHRTSFNAGKIAIPFGPIFLHQVLGGIVEKPTLGGSQTHFMVPHVWTEYGLQFNHRFVDAFAYNLEGKFWLTNGLSGEVRAADRTVDFTKDPPLRDFNLDKALGFRLNQKFMGLYGLNFSFYTAKWAPDRRNEDGSLKEKFYEGDRLYMGNADLSIPYNTVKVPVLKNFKFLLEYAAIRTRSTLKSGNGAGDQRLPWHTKSADLFEMTYNGLHRFFDLQFRYGTYDDNWDVLNGRDLIHYNASLIYEVAGGIHLIPMYMWNREWVNEVEDDFFFLKLFIEL